MTAGMKLSVSRGRTFKVNGKLMRFFVTSSYCNNTLLIVLATIFRLFHYRTDMM